MKSVPLKMIQMVYRLNLPGTIALQWEMNICLLIRGSLFLNLAWEILTFAKIGDMSKAGFSTRRNHP